MNRKKFFLLYIFFAILIAYIDSLTLPIYLIVVPVQCFFLNKALKYKNFPFLILESLWFIALGIGAVTFYLGRENAQSIGFRAIGNFNFSYKDFFVVYSYLLLLQSVVYLLVKRYHLRAHDFAITDFLKCEISKFQRNTSLSLAPIFVSVGVFSLISAWMYISHIGMVGLHQTRLPYHLTGILFYSRRFLFTAVLVYLFLKTRNKPIAAFIVIVYAFFVSIVGTSKSLGLLLLVPVAFISYVSNYKKTCWFTFFSIVVIYNIVSVLRVFIYEEDAVINLAEVFSNGLPLFFADFSMGAFLVDFIDGFCERLYNYQSAVLTYQYNGATLKEFNEFYFTGAVATKLVPDYASTLFGIVLPEDKAYGLGWGYVGTYILLSCHNYILAFLQSLIIGVNIVFQGNYYHAIMTSAQRPIKYVAIGLVSIGLMGFIDGNQIFYLYVPTFLLGLLARFINKK